MKILLLLGLFTSTKLVYSQPGTCIILKLRTKYFNCIPRKNIHPSLNLWYNTLPCVCIQSMKMIYICGIWKQHFCYWMFNDDFGQVLLPGLSIFLRNRLNYILLYLTQVCAVHTLLFFLDWEVFMWSFVFCFFLFLCLSCSVFQVKIDK